MHKGIIIRQEKPIYGTNVALSVKVGWKRLPPVLHNLKESDCSIQKAKYFGEWTSMYIKTPNNVMADDVHRVVVNGLNEDMAMSTLYSPGLPFNTKIFIYNISTCPYTVLDFGCFDRTGLFCEIIEVLSRYDINIEAAYINTIGNVVSNIFYITHKGSKLSDLYIEYLKNNLESEVKMQESDSYWFDVFLCVYATSHIHKNRCKNILSLSKNLHVRNQLEHRAISKQQIRQEAVFKMTSSYMSMSKTASLIEEVIRYIEERITETDETRDIFTACRRDMLPTRKKRVTKKSSESTKTNTCNKPLRALTITNLFVQDKMAQFKIMNVKMDPTKGNVLKQATSAWNELSEEKRQAYKEANAERLLVVNAARKTGIKMPPDPTALQSYDENAANSSDSDT